MTLVIMMPVPLVFLIWDVGGVSRKHTLNINVENWSEMNFIVYDVEE